MFRFNLLVFCLITIYFVRMKSQLAKERTALMNRYILHQDYSRCSDAEVGFYELCEMHSQEDEMMEKECGFENQQCLDGSYDKTCMVLYMNADGSKSYTCTCQDHKQSVDVSTVYKWRQWDELPDSRVGLYREMHDDLVASLVTEYRFGLGFVVKKLPVSSFTASSELDVYWSARHMRLPAVNNGWIPHGTDTTPWIQIDMLQVYTIRGLYMKRRDGSTQHMPIFDMKSSVDSTNYTYIGQDIVPVYHQYSDQDEVSAIYWFDQAVDGRYWRIEIDNSEGMQLYLRGDFIGHM